MKTYLKRLHWWLVALGFDLRKTLACLRNLLLLVKEYAVLKKKNEDAERKWHIKFSMPCFCDRHEQAGCATGHYFHQDLFVAQKVFQRNPRKHVDVGSSVAGFVAHVAAFRPIEVFDIRPIKAKVENIAFRQCDFMNFPKDLAGYADSVSCLHALEHFGLGRYGDPIDIDGYVRGFEGLCKILQPKGILYLSLPIGRERIEFNAHRVFSVKTILSLANDHFDLLNFSYVDDDGGFHREVAVNDNEQNDSYGLNFGCGIFEFRKK